MSNWSVKDIAGHLLDGTLRRLSVHRDGHRGKRPGPAPGELQAYLDTLNADWVGAMDRVSPRVLVSLLRNTGDELADFFAGLAPYDPPCFSVDWAGTAGNVQWMDVAATTRRNGCTSNKSGMHSRGKVR